ncbi:unnamed protein product [Arabidopsis arenosa]|uniref:DUF4283 domain-containing protein n=1 Tax=Arabidopsis arenosa TaxID=38785 RepID=A0A8S2AXA5_ARAAE|nr:unnamed protein product [Arabidopsis arenosa]
MADKDLWLALQNLNLGSDRRPIKLSLEAIRKKEADHQLSLVVKGLHPSQNPAGIKLMMPRIWKLEGRVSSRINEDGTVQFFFKYEHQMLNVLDHGPWTYKDWLVVVDKWINRRSPDFLRMIPFWIRVLNIPDDSKEKRSIEEIGGVLGHVEEVHIQQPTADTAGEVWIRVKIDISDRLIFARYFQLDVAGEPTLIRYVYDKLRKFCTKCGSLIHMETNCNFHEHEAERLQLPAPAQVSSQVRPAENPEQRPHTPTEEADDTMEETVGSNINMDTSEVQLHDNTPGEFMDSLNLVEANDVINATFAVKEIGSASVPAQDRGTKRKAEDTNVEDEVSTSRQRTHGAYLNQATGEVDINRRHKLDIMFLVETKNKDSFVRNLCKDLQFDHHFLVSPDGLSGGLAIFWRNTVKCDFISTPTLYCTDMYITEGSTTFCLTYIYGNPERKPRQQQWMQMEALIKAGLYQNKPRVVLGDFNEIKSNSEKLGGAQRPEWQFANFRRMLRVAGLHDLKTYGGIYTWIGNRSSGTIKSRLDRVVANADWKDKFPRAFAQLLEWIGSDHRPLLLHTENSKWRGKKLFRYDNRWRLFPEAHSALQDTWNQKCSMLPPTQFNEALKRCRHSLACWKSTNNLNSQKKIQQLHRELQSANQMDSVIQLIQPKVTQEMNCQLTKPVTEKEVYQALSHMSIDKTPGPDGLNAGFYKFHWNTIKTAMQQDQPPPGNLEIQNYLEDILLINKGMYHFKHIPREINAMADKLAREARVMKSPFVVSWVT